MAYFCNGGSLKECQAVNIVRKWEFVVLELQCNEVCSEEQYYLKDCGNSLSGYSSLNLLAWRKISFTEHENNVFLLSSAAVLLISKMTYSSRISHHFKALIHTERLRSTWQVTISAGCLFLQCIILLVILNCFTPQGHTAHVLGTGTDLLWISKKN